jgi:hypothetical protein
MNPFTFRVINLEKSVDSREKRKRRKKETYTKYKGSLMGGIFYDANSFSSL